MLFAFLLLPAVTPASVYVENSVTLTREILDLPAGSVASYEYSLEAGRELIFSLRLARWRRQSLRIWLVDAVNYARLDAGNTFDYIAAGSGVVRREALIAVEIERSGRYFVVIDNSAASSTREIEVYAFARGGEPNPGDERIQKFYEAHYASLDALLELGATRVDVRRCGGVNAYTIGSNVVICRELDNLLSVFATPGVRSFILFHEVSHSLIDAWGYRSIVRNQLLVDRLAAALFAAVDEDGLAEAAASWFLRDFSLENDVVAEEFSISKSRARRIARWLREDGQLDRPWTRRIVVPRFRTEALEKLAESDHLDAVSRRRVQIELAERQAADAAAVPLRSSPVIRADSRDSGSQVLAEQDRRR